MKKENESKKIKILKIIFIILAILLIGELIFFGIKLYKNRIDNPRYTLLNNIIEKDNGFVGVGLSDYKNSKYLEYKKPGYTKATLFIYDKDLNKINEISYSKGYNSYFIDVIKVSDGYVAIGVIEPNKTYHEAARTKGLIVKYDEKFNVVKEKQIEVLDITTLNKIKLDKDGNYVVVGSSVYEKNVIGNHKSGGAILLKYNSNLEELQKINLGGPQTDSFNDFVITNDGYVVVGMINTGTGIIYKYNFKGKELWHNYYGYTDPKGLTSIVELNNNYYVTGSKLSAKDKTDEYKGVILKYDNNGKLIKEQEFKEEKITRLDKLFIDSKNNIIALSVYGNKDNNRLDNDSYILKYNIDLELIKKKNLVGNKTVTFTGVIETCDEYLVSAHTNSKFKEHKTNGLDYYDIIIKYNLDLKQK